MGPMVYVLASDNAINLVWSSQCVACLAWLGDILEELIKSMQYILLHYLISQKC